MVRHGSEQGTAVASREEPEQPLRVAVFTTTYPRHEGENVPMFVAHVVDHLRQRGIQIDVVGPGVYRDFGLTSFGGGGLVHNLKRRPWAAPLAFGSMAKTLRRAAGNADLVHVNWLLAASVARFAGRPFLVTLHGTPTAGPLQDVELARRAPWLVRLLLGRARVVISPSEQLAEAIRACGVANVRVIPYGVEIPADIGQPDEPPVVLYAGRLSPEKGIDIVAEATAGMNRIVAGDGPLRHLLPDALGFVSQTELHELYRRASVVVMASRGEGLPNVMLEAMAHARPVVATPVGGIPSMIVDGITGLLVPVDDAEALRTAIERLLADRELRRRMGTAARERVRSSSGWERVTELTLAAYNDALLRG